MAKERELRMAVIAGASHALKFKITNRNATDDEALRHVSEHMDDILSSMDNPL